MKDSAWRTFKTFLDENGIPYSQHKTDLTLEFYSSRRKTRNVIQFSGLDDPKKIKSFKGCTGEWLEEATDFTEADFIDIDLILREQTGHYHQILMSFNPDEARAPWLKKMFFPSSIPITGPGLIQDSFIHHSTIADNPIQEMREKYYQVLKRIKDPILRQIYIAGRWAAPKGQIFSWDIVPNLPEIGFDQILYGGDFGFSFDPAACVKIHRRSHEYWIELLLYETGLTDPAMAQVLKEDPRFDPEMPSYWDNVEPKAIKTLRDKQINARPCTKTKRVMVQIDQLKEFEIHIVENELSYHLVDEVRRYKLKQLKNGEIARPLQPVDAFDHAISATRYGIFTNFDLYLREAYKKGRAHFAKGREQMKEKEPGRKAAITAAGRLVPLETVGTDEATPEPEKPKKGGYGYGTRKGRISRHR